MAEAGVDVQALQQALGYRFRDPQLLDLALNHESYANEQVQPFPSNERLEFLGDAVLGLLVSEYLYHRHPEEPEGKLAQMKAYLVSTGHLAQKARQVGLGHYVRLGRGEVLAEGGRERVNLLADALEAIIGAIYLDGGLGAAEDFTTRHFQTGMDDLSGARKDYKSLLQELTQRHFKALPEYVVVGEEGPPHDRTFQVQVQFEGLVLGEGTGRSKREASQKAANQALDGVEQGSESWQRLLLTGVEEPSPENGNSAEAGPG